MPLFPTNGPHIDGAGDLKIMEDIALGREQFHKCNNCDSDGPNLWLCLNPDCQYVGCDEKQSDHSSYHYSRNPLHTAQMNLTSNRIWCYSCQSEIEIELVNYKTALSILKKSVAKENDTVDRESAKLLSLILIKKYVSQYHKTICYMTSKWSMWEKRFLKPSLQCYLIKNCIKLTLLFANLQK